MVVSRYYEGTVLPLQYSTYSTVCTVLSLELSTATLYYTDFSTVPS